MVIAELTQLDAVLDLDDWYDLVMPLVQLGTNSVIDSALKWHSTRTRFGFDKVFLELCM
jgi:hypothetical protein